MFNRPKPFLILLIWTLSCLQSRIVWWSFFFSIGPVEAGEINLSFAQMSLKEPIELSAPLTAQSQSSPDETPIDVTKAKLTAGQKTIEDEQEQNDLEIYFGIEGRETRDRRSERPANLKQTSIKEARFGLKSQLAKDLSGLIEVSIEDFQGQSEFYLRDAWVKGTPLSGLDLKVGQFFQPIGWFGPEDFWFVHLPRYYDQLFKGDKPIDIGAQLNWRPFNWSPLFELEAACFRGQIFRKGDGRFDEPEQEPCMITMRSKSEYHHFFLTHHRQHLAFFDPVESTGFGLDLDSPSFGRLGARISLTGEHWSISELQNQGLDLLTRGWMVYPHIDLWRVSLGMRFGQTSRSFETTVLGPQGLRIREQVIRAEVRFHKYVSLVFEDHLEVSDRLSLRDDVSFRLLFRTAQW